MLIADIDRDLKASLLGKDELRVSTLRSLKSAITYARVEDKAAGGDGELGDEKILAVFAHEAKKRQESAEAFTKGGASDRAEKELAEKAIIDEYLPAQLSESELEPLIEAAIKESGASSVKDMGKVIGLVKARTGVGADGAMIARLVKTKLESQQ